MELANYDAVMTSYFPGTSGHRYSRTDYWPFTGFDDQLLLNTARCGGNPLNSPTTNTRQTGALSTGPNPPIGSNAGNAIVAITDGTSNTLFFTEIAARGLKIYIKGKSIASTPNNASRHPSGRGRCFPRPSTADGSTCSTATTSS